MIDGEPIPTIFESATDLIGTIPRDVFIEPGDKKLVVRGLQGRSNALNWSVTRVDTRTDESSGSSGDD